MKCPFHEIAAIHRQDLPYASLLRQELDFAGIPHTGVPYHRLADTPPGRFLRGMIDLAMGVADADPPTVDRDRLINWLNSTGVTDGLPLPANHHPRINGNRSCRALGNAGSANPAPTVRCQVGNPG